MVYLGQDTRLQRPVAIKALPSECTDDDRFRARLRQEAMTTAALSHPGIATVYALEEIYLHLYLVSEYVAGKTLRDLLADGPLPLGMLLDVAVDVATALEAAHGGGVIHRDLKPENIMRTPSATVKVLDFGLARFDSAPLATCHPSNCAAMTSTSELTISRSVWCSTSSLRPAIRSRGQTRCRQWLAS